MSTISSCGILVAIALIVFNIWNNHRRFVLQNNKTKYFLNLFFILIKFRVIQSSHPVCNTIMLFGVITCLVSVILLGIDGRFVSPTTYPIV